jgi:tetratricopeptide (TPR) repeat protein
LNKQRFINILKIPGNLKDDLPDLQELQQNYPYAQAIHVLVALAHKQKNTNYAANALNYAAMYVADRHNLKELVTIKKSFKAEPEEKNSSESIVVQEETGAIKQPGILPEPPVEAAPDNGHENQKAIDDKPGEKHASPNKDRDEPKGQTEQPGAAKKAVTKIGSKFREKLLQKLKKLQNAKEKWSSGIPSEEEVEKDVLVEKIDQTVKSKSGEEKAKKADKVKKEKTGAKKSTKANTSAKSLEETSTKAPEKKSIEASGDVEPDKIKKQQELISRFIEISPSIKAKANKPPIISADQEDLSVPSTSFQDNLISENLADIMVSQGKDDKAIDIYKKLIWKFPQKKAYFASRIEELTKKKG